MMFGKAFSNFKLPAKQPQVKVGNRTVYNKKSIMFSLTPYQFFVKYKIQKLNNSVV